MRTGLRGALILVAALIAGGAETYAAPTAPPCDVDLIRARAQRDFPGARVVDVLAEGGIVTLVIEAPDGNGRFAVALHAVGTRLSTSVTGVGLGTRELGRASAPVTTWWQVPDVQRALDACGESLPEASLAGLDAALHAAAEAGLGQHTGYGSDPWVRLGAFCFLLLTGGALVGLWRARNAIVGGDGAMLLALTALALGLRFVAHAGPSDVRAVIEETGLRRAGWAAFLHLVFSVLPRTDETIWTINRIVGALSVPLLYAVMRRRFADRTAALAGAAALAVTPLIVRFSASDAPYIPLCAALLGAVVAYDRYVDTGATGAMALGLGLLTAALQLRPEGAWLVVPAALVAVAGGVPRRPRSPLQLLSFAICALLFLVANVAGARWTLAGVGGQRPEGFVLVGSLIGSPWADPQMTPRTLGVLVVLGIISVLLYRHRWPGLLWLAAACVALPLNFPVMVTSGVPIEGHVGVADAHQYANARYHLPAMYLGCGLAGLGVAAALDLARRLTGRAVSAGAVIGIVLLAAAPRIDVLWRMWTPQREFEFFRAASARVGPECNVVTLLEGMDAGFAPFTYLRSGMIDVDAFLAGAPPGDCFVYYRSGNCYALDLVAPASRLQSDVNPRCRAIEERFRLEPIAEASLPAVPYRGEVYSRDPVLVGFYRLRDGRDAR